MDLLERAKHIDGWMTEEELAWLHNAASGKPCVLEVGSWGGRSAMALRSAGKVVCVDHWQGDSRIKHYLGSKFNDTCSQKEQQFRDVHCDAIAIGKLVPIVADTQTAKGIFKVQKYFSHGMRPTMVFVDAAHDYDSACNDIQLALSVSEPGALICGHDYYEQEMPGLVEAIREFLPNYKLGAGTLWYATKE